MAFASLVIIQNNVNIKYTTTKGCLLINYTTLATVNLGKYDFNEMETFR